MHLVGAKSFHVEGHNKANSLWTCLQSICWV